MRARSRACSREPPAELLHRFVERPRDGAELVVAVAEARRREIAAAVALARRRRSSRTRWPMRAENSQAIAARADQRERRARSASR